MKKRTFGEYMENPIKAKDKRYQKFFDFLWSYDSRIDGHEDAEFYWYEEWKELLDSMFKFRK